jgi:hypothetical protein
LQGASVEILRGANDASLKDDNVFLADRFGRRVIYHRGHREHRGKRLGEHTVLIRVNEGIED